MNRRVHAGPFVPDLESNLLHNLETQRAADPLEEIWVLVPSLPIRRRLRKRLAERGGCFNVRFVLFPDLAGELAAISARPRGEPICLDAGAARLILQGIVGRLPTQASYFGDVRTRGGFIEALESTLDDLDHAGIEPAAIRDLARSGKAGISAAKLSELALIQAGWQEAIRARGYESRAGLLWRAAEAAGAFGARHLHVYGFYDLNGVQRRLVEALSRDRDVIFYFPSVGPDGLAYSRPLREWLAREGFAFEESGSGLPVPASTTIFSAAGERREAEEVARRVLREIGAGTRPDEIAIVYRSADPYAEVLAAVLARAGIPAACHDRPPLSGTRPAQALLLFGRAALSDYARRDVMNFLDVALPMHPVHGPDSVAACSAWDRLTIDAGITRGYGEWFARLKLLGETHEHYLRDESRAVAGFLAVLADLFRAFERFRASATWREFTARLLEGGEPWVTPGPERDHLFETVGALGGLDRTGEPATGEMFEAVLTDLLDGTPIPAAREPRAAVHVGDLLSIRGLAFERIFVVGVTEKVFPRAVQPDPILLDRERKELAVPPAAGGAAAWLPPRAAAIDEESYLFALVRAAARHLTLSWSRIEPARARPRLPSIFLLKAGSELRGTPVDYHGLDSLVERVPLDLMAAASAAGAREPERLQPPDAFTVRSDSALDLPEFERMLVALAAGAERPGRLAGLCGSSPVLRRAIAADRARWGERRFTAYDGAIASPAARDVLKAMLPADRTYSASQLERYARCPFCYFLERLLGVESIEMPEDQEGPDARRRGTLIHLILQEFLAGHAGADLVSADRETLRAELLALAGRRMDEFKAREVTGVPLSWAIERDAMLDDLSLWLDFELDRGDDLRPARLEWSFGFADATPPAPPLRLKLSDGSEVALRGKIDRLDFSPDGSRVRVVDYKTGKPPDKYEDDLDGGRRLQLATYLLATAQAFPEVRSGSAEYLHLKNGLKAIALVRRDFAPLRAELSAAVETLVRGIESGCFFPFPEPRTCQYCYQPICGAGMPARFERKKGDPRLEAFRALRGEA